MEYRPISTTAPEGPCTAPDAAGPAAQAASPTGTGALPLRSGDTLLLVDLQRDFLPGGSLPVPFGEEALAGARVALAAFVEAGLPVAASRDWHPADHCSFTARGGPWPAHAVAGTVGADFGPGLELPGAACIVSKATQASREAYSGFDGTDLARQLDAVGTRRLFVAGLATDWCVRATVLDALAFGYEVVLLGDAIAAVDAHPGDGARALAEMVQAGARLAETGELGLRPGPPAAASASSCAAAARSAAEMSTG
jgi:nicotinamidase/pyrazinamidase